MKERKDLKRMSAAMMKVKSPLKKADPPEASTTYVDKKSEPFSYDRGIMEKMQKQEKEKKAKEAIRTDMISRGKWKNEYEGSQGMTSAELEKGMIDRTLSPLNLTGDELTRKEKKAIRKSQRKNKSSKVTDDMYKAGIVGIGPSTPAIEVEGHISKDIRPIGTGTGYSIGNKAIASVAPMPGTTGEGVTLIPEPSTPPLKGKMKDLDVKKSKTPKPKGFSRSKNKILKKGLFGGVKFKKR